MPEFLRIGAIKFFIYSNEESRPHIHVKVREFEAKVWLDNLELAKSNAPSRLNNKIVKLVQKHQSALLESWHEFFGGNYE
jgi:hypothetical protein